MGKNIKSLLRNVGLSALVALSAPNVASAQKVDVVADSVTLAWNASSSGNISGYNVYVGDSSGGYNNKYTQFTPGTTNTSPVLFQNNFYAVTATNSFGLESMFSNEVSYNPPNYDSINASIIQKGGTNFYRINYSPVPTNSGISFSLTTNDFAGYKNISSNQWSKINVVESRSITDGKLTATIDLLVGPNVPLRTTILPQKNKNPSNVSANYSQNNVNVSFKAADYPTIKNYFIYAKLVGGATTRFAAPTNSVNGNVSRVLSGLKANSQYQISVSGYVGTNPGGYETVASTPITVYTGAQQNIGVSGSSENPVEIKPSLSFNSNGMNIGFSYLQIIDDMPHKLSTSTNLSNWYYLTNAPEYSTNSGEIDGKFKVNQTKDPQRFFKIVPNNEE